MVRGVVWTFSHRIDRPKNLIDSCDSAVELFVLLLRRVVHL